jgi:hypothetical protein
MSQFVPKLRERDGTQWPVPPGTWKQQEDISHLATFADKLDVTNASADTDLLNSVPTPWARLLLFETALFNKRHPAHRDIVKQWRGLLGVLGLARPLGLRLDAAGTEMNINLEESARESQVAKTFLDLRPQHVVGDGDLEELKWGAFQMVSVGGVVLGATSPRTLVFTGVAHRCPPAVPFQTPQGRLTDPLLYYKKFKDGYFIALLDHWLAGFIKGVEGDGDLKRLLGTVPAPEGTNPTSRHTLVCERLKEWQAEMRAELKAVPRAALDSAPVTVFGLQPYAKAINGLPEIKNPAPPPSELLMKGRKTNVVVGYHPSENDGTDHNSVLLDAQGNPVQNEPLKLYDGWWHVRSNPLPDPLDFFPTHLGLEVINDPATQLFEENLIQIRLPANSDAVQALRMVDGGNTRAYLYPFKREILDYLAPGTLAANTRIIADADKRSLRVELTIPLVNGRAIRAARDYSFSTNVVVDPFTAELAVWPDFAAPNWKHYFYFKSSVSDTEVDFKPVTDEPVLPRSKENKYSWYRTTKAVEAFAGTIDHKSGLLLLRYERPPERTKFWNVGIDFGSTHTRAFSLSVNPVDGGYKARDRADINPITFGAYTRQFTRCDQTVLDDNFFPTSGTLNPPTREELKSLLMTPIPLLIAEERDWLPREGFVYMHWLFERPYDENRLKDNIKWEEGRTKYDLRAFLRCLLIMLQAEAVKQGAEIVLVNRSYPSAFTATLEAEHNDEWWRLGQFMNLQISDANLSEAVATCRYLEYEVKAPVMSNTISLDIGGSTTDIAIWAGKVVGGQKKARLEVQESVKMAAGIVGRYLQSPRGADFLQWFVGKMGEYENVGSRVNVNNLAGSRPNYALMFFNLLSYLEATGGERKEQLNNIIGLIKAAKIEGGSNHILLSHIIFLFGGLLYYAGLLARKAGLADREQGIYYVYFCGKGGTLIKWINDYEGLAQKMFEAGLFGPEGRGQRQPPRVQVKLSPKPKEEVGRGLLAQSALEGNPRDDGIGLLDLGEASVTVGETGYGELKWSDKLSADVLRQLPTTLPPVSELKELQNFVQTFKDNVATTFDLDNLHEGAYRDQLEQHLFQRNRGEREGDILVEPLFITELKVLLEMLTGNDKLFD